MLGRKSLIHTHLHYLVFVSPPFAPSAGAASATVRNFAARRATEAPVGDITKVTVLDPENKFVAHSSAFTEGIRMVFTAWGKLYVLSNEGQVSHRSICLSLNVKLTIVCPAFVLGRETYASEA